MIRSGNPVLNAETFRALAPSTRGDTMTIQGTVNKTAILLFCVLFTASWTWSLFFARSPLVFPLMIAGVVGGLIFALITSFKKDWAMVTAPAYALLEGLALGGISSMMEARFPNIVIQAVALTFCTLFALLSAYKSGIIKATENFKLGVVAATGG